MGVPTGTFFSAQTGHVLSTQTYGQGPEGALTICFEERISANRRGILELTAFNSSHYQFENEPFANKKWPGLPLSPGKGCVFFLSRHTSGTANYSLTNNFDIENQFCHF